MKYVLGLSIAIALSLTFPATAAEWVLVDRTSNGQGIYVDKTSIRRVNQFSWFWLSGPAPASIRQDIKEAETFMVYLSVDCKTGTTRFREVAVYNASKKLIYQIAPGDRGPVYQRYFQQDGFNKVWQMTCRG